MPNSPLRPNHADRLPWRTPVLCAAAAAMVAALDGAQLDLDLGAPRDAVGRPIESLAAMPVGPDEDGDGLVYDQEILLGTSPFEADSDADGFKDSEEFARQSDPLDPLSVPATDGVSASLTARGEEGALRLVITLYEPAGLAQYSMLRIGALVQGNVVSVPLERFLPTADLIAINGSGGAEVTTIDVPVHPSFVHGAGMVTFFLAAGQTNTMTFGSAAKIDVRSEAGELVLQRPAQASLASGGAPRQQGGSLRQPIPVSGPPTGSAGWVSGAICYQRSEVVGVNGPRLLHQIVEADCLEGWDSYCSGECAASVGTTYETVDPLALIGG